MRIPRAVKRLIEEFEKLPGIGPKTAQRLTFYLLHFPQANLDRFASSLGELKRKTKLCTTCFNVDETDPCSICEDRIRDQGTICVVEQPLDILALERSDGYNGVYHVLHGVISPLNNMGPDSLRISELLPRLKNGRILELILATNPTMEGEATAMYIKKIIDDKSVVKNGMKITRIGRGLPVGGDLEYADEVTLKNALNGRGKF